jgi:hypothetical protein
MQTTTNYGLKKIELVDSPPDITVINPNWDIVDMELKKAEDARNQQVYKDGSVPMEDVTVGTRIGSIGQNSSVFGGSNTATGRNSVSEGQLNTSAGLNSLAEGEYNVAATEAAHVEGYASVGSNGVAYKITAYNNTSKTIILDKVTGLTVGDKLDIKRTNNVGIVDIPITTINGLVVTLNTTNTIDASWAYAIERAAVQFPIHVEGTNNLATGNSSHSEGTGNVASGDSSHVEGIGNNASGNGSHVGGSNSYANSLNSFAHGSGLGSSGNEQAVFGRYNAPNASDLFQVGMGTSNADKKNALRVTSDGDIINGYGDSLHAISNDVLRTGFKYHNLFNMYASTMAELYGVKIKTNILSSEAIMMTLFIKGYDYSGQKPIDICISLYNYPTDGRPIMLGYSTINSFTPVVKTGYENGKLVIHLAFNGNYYTLYGEAVCFSDLNMSQMRGWNVLNENITSNPAYDIPLRA